MIKEAKRKLVELESELDQVSSSRPIIVSRNSHNRPLEKKLEPDNFLSLLS